MDAVSGWFSSIAKPLFTPAEVPRDKEDVVEDPPSANKNNDRLATDGQTENKTEVKSAVGGGKGLEDAAKKAMDSAKFFTSSLYSMANKVVKEGAGELKSVLENKTLLGNLEVEQQKFIEEQRKQPLITTPAQDVVASPPWSGCVEETAIKKKILTLSLDSRNVLRDPPPATDFVFNYAEYVPLAVAVLNADPNLRKMRFELVPKQVKEERFWRNYFYRVSLIKHSASLDTFAKLQQSGIGNPAPSTAAVSDVASPENSNEGANKITSGATTDNASPTVTDFVSDSGMDVEATEEELEQARRLLGIVTEKVVAASDKPGMEAEWEKELLADLNDYELVTEQTGKNDREWEDEIADLLEKESDELSPTVEEKREAETANEK